MKFITEDDLRLRYRNEPFTIYDPEPGTRLTPGARQFLVDRRIEMPEDDTRVQPVIRESITKEICCSTANPAHNQTSPKSDVMSGDWRIHMIRAKMDTIHAVFLKTEQALLSCDVNAAQQLTELGKYYESVRRMVNGKGGNTDFAQETCDVLKKAEALQDSETNIEITEFHVQLENGREILELNELRYALKEIHPLVQMAVEGNSLDNSLGTGLICCVDRIIKSLSHMINVAVGGKACRR